MDDKHIEFLVLWRRVGAETFEALDVTLEGVFDVGLVRCEGLRVVEAVQQLENELAETAPIEALGKRLPDEISCLFLDSWGGTR